MPPIVEKLKAEALSLPLVDRARLAEKLIASLDTDADVDVEEAWAAEVERRQAEVESGAAVMLPRPETLADIRASFR